MEYIFLKLLMASSILLMGLGVRYLLLKDKSKFSEVLKTYFYPTYLIGIVLIIVSFFVIKWLK